ncbi:fumarylacetoacetate hydrolase family protein [Nitratireductor sp. StC3]|uniref:fumarylacetoacetate hydrolase family protein n=1 Tax=Nitratireductor sp. StC3 TaxID=2126741 RepID=UPI000D0CF901|nr:fumarylacetoacetate hydrolase family protein [Nitratireductor sp. StC3]PSM16408.1 5-carboxymethyl-2-hydroxymuconate isomerase [Nitratireductor sp. StC3]
MKLMSYVTPSRASFGVADGERVYDLGCRLGGDLVALLRDGGLERAAAVVKGASADFHLDDLCFLPVVPNPGKIVCVGLNYKAHRAEGNHDTEKPAAPSLFLRTAESQTGHGRALVIPRESDQFDFEAEMAVVIGRAGRRIPRARALEHVAGISCYNDGSVRDWQLAVNQWTAGKNFPATGSFGPWMVTADEIAPDSSLALKCRLNGQVMQDTTTDLMMFDLAEQIEHVSTFMTLNPGDVIVTGTPGGVGLRRDPPVWMKHGDTVEVELEGVGILRNTVVKEPAA